MLNTESLPLLLVVPANAFYTLAAFTHEWFRFPPHSFYGLWWAKFCDHLRCQLVPAVLFEEPMWYHVLQGLSLVGWCGMGASLVMLLSSAKPLLHRRQQTISIICILSVFLLSSSLILFYTKLTEASPTDRLQVSWSACLAVVACVCELTAGVLLLKVPPCCQSTGYSKFG